MIFQGNITSFITIFQFLVKSDEEVRNFRLVLSKVTSEIIFTGMWLLGIEMPERM